MNKYFWLNMFHVNIKLMTHYFYYIAYMRAKKKQAYHILKNRKLTASVSAKFIVTWYSYFWKICIHNCDQNSNLIIHKGNLTLSFDFSSDLNFFMQLHYFAEWNLRYTSSIQGVSKVFRHLKWAVCGELVHLNFFEEIPNEKKYQSHIIWKF